MRLGFIGSGFISQFQARSLLQVRGIELHGILNRSNAHSLSSFCRQNNIGKAVIYDTIKELVNNVDAIAIFTPNYLRVAIMEEIASSIGPQSSLIGVICEKPLGRNVHEAKQMVKLAREAKLLTAYYENQIFMKSVQNQRSQLALLESAMGPVYLSRSAEEHGGPHSSWFWDPQKLGGGVLMDMGCHSIAVGRYILTPQGEPLDFLIPLSINVDIGLLKWGLPKWRKKLLKKTGIDYNKTPAEDYVTGIITYLNPKTGQKVKSQFTDSWMFEKQGLRLSLDGIGPGYSFDINTLISPLQIFIGDDSASKIKNLELALEKSTASHGLLSVQLNEPDLYGYVDENIDMFTSFSARKDSMLNWEYGLDITRLVIAAYLSAERKCAIDLQNKNNIDEIETYIPLIQQGKGSQILF